ncbi:hypothetical protein [Halorhabdus amylolytica]|uniref:hypothetical protein n=1 Tax=Halorhabdus amylolytica TaxID=2559573 RepID=UPI0010AA949B|nr:hypothetical protein [Halorhabdus amylolytica]
MEVDIAIEDLDRIPHPTDRDVVRITEGRRDGTPIYRLEYSDGRIVWTTWADAFCTACDDNEAYTPERGTPPGTAQQKRAAANCEHAAIASEAFHLRNHVDSECSTCGAWEVTSHNYRQAGQVILTEYWCAECGARRR